MSYGNCQGCGRSVIDREEYRSTGGHHYLCYNRMLWDKRMEELAARRHELGGRRSLPNDRRRGAGQEAKIGRMRK